MRFCTRPASSSSLYPVIGKGLAPWVAARAAAAMVFGETGAPCAASAAMRRIGTGATPPAVNALYERPCARTLA